MDERTNNSAPHLEYVWDVFAGLGYGGSRDILVSSDYGVPQPRKLALLLSIHCVSCGYTHSEAKAVASKVFDVARRLQAPSLPLQDFTLDSAHPLVRQELKRRQK